MHVILKYNDNIYNVDTIKRHKEILDEKGSVIWGLIKPNIKSPGIAVTRINKIKTQIADGKDVYAYLATTGEIKARGRISDVLSNFDVSNNSYLVPEYYQKDLDRCIVGFLFNKIETMDSSSIENLQRYNSEKGKVALSNQTNPLYVSNIYDDPDYSSKSEIKKGINENIESFKEEDVESVLKHIYRYINSKGFIFSYEDICNIYLSLKTKPFLILAGISGTGKSKMVNLFSEAINATSENGRYRILSVKPDWNDSTELFGYKNINDKFVPGILTSIIAEASSPANKNKPYFICLDEMNLARVEYYLSEYLSIIESRKSSISGEINTDRIFPKNYLDKNDIYSNLTIPENIYIIGTVNMDDTTFAFSKKVLDRGNTIEYSEVKLEELDFLDESIDSINVDNRIFKTKFLSIKDSLREDRDYVTNINAKIIIINNILATVNQHFGYRVRDEIVFYMLENKLNKLLDEELAFDYQILQKILPAISGSDYFIKEILIQLYNFCNPEGEITGDIDYINQGVQNLDTAKYMGSAKKIILMLRGYEDGFVSFW